MYIYIYIYTHLSLCMYIYIYRERETTCMHIYIYIHIYGAASRSSRRGRSVPQAAPIVPLPQLKKPHYTIYAIYKYI